MKSTENSTLEEVKAEFAKVNEMMGELESCEPKNEDSQEYKDWERKCEELALDSERLMTLIDKKMSSSYL